MSVTSPKLLILSLCFHQTVQMVVGPQWPSLLGHLTTPLTLPTPPPRRLKCCRSLRVSSNALGPNFQPDRMGIYAAKSGILNNRNLYKHIENTAYIYYWDWGDGKGENWMISNNFQDDEHGIESFNLEGRGNGWCPEHINKSKYPFLVYANHGWQKDTSLRVECFSPDLDCCKIVEISSSGAAKDHQADRLGVYVQMEEKFNERAVYKNVEGDDYLYYYDWGPNSGANWMVSNWIGATVRGIESHNVEFGYTNETSLASYEPNPTWTTQCVTEAGVEGPWMAFVGEEAGWQRDYSFEVRCI